ncbi:MAG: VOC family protein [Sphingomonadales bacterium]|nr:VOC family protein [Sphingomonadales bacterium]
MSNPITPCIWMNGTAEEAANFYVSLFDDSRIDAVMRYTADQPFPPSFPPGTALMVSFTIKGQPFATLNGGPQFPQTEAVSFVIPVESQAELDRYWTALIADGGAESMCGWCKDKYGVSWQVVPRQLLDMQHSGTREQVARLWRALLAMRKLDLAALEAAFAGEAA